MNVRLGFTGSETAPDPDRLVDRVIRNLPNVFPDVTEVTTGGAAGVDTECYYALRDAFPGALHCLALPRGFRFNEAVLRSHESLNGLTIWADGPLKRNDMIIVGADILVAFPETGAEKQRSGTWSTIRRARKKGIPIFVFPLNGDDPWMEGGVPGFWSAFADLTYRCGYPARVR